MRKCLTIIFLLLWHAWCVTAQEDFSSPLPIVIIETDLDPSTGLPTIIPDEPKVGASMKIIYVNDKRINHLSDQDDPSCLNYNGRIGIELRGFTSQWGMKKPYGVETRHNDGSNRNVSLLGLPKENDWVFNPMYYDDSFVRDCLSYRLGSLTGQYAPRTHYCELFLNGDYHGLYLLVEKIKIDHNRVNIAKMSPTDTLEPNITGGYIFKADRPSGNETAAWTTNAHGQIPPVTYVFHSPKPADIAPQQADYLRNFFLLFCKAVADGDTSSETGYPGMIDVRSFIDFMLIGELSSNVDIYQLSTYFHKDRKGKIHAGPLWDFNLSFGNDFSDRSQYDQWQFDNNDNTGSQFWFQLFNDPWFHRQLANRWRRLSAANGPLSFHNTLRIMDSIVQHIAPVVDRENHRWGRIYDYEEHILAMRNWIRQRFLWMNQQLLGPVASDKGIILTPNPTTGLMTIIGKSQVESISIYDLHGRYLLTAMVDHVAHSIDISPLPSGIYVAHIVTPQETLIRKIVKVGRQP